MDRPPLPDQTKDMFCHAIYTAWHVVNRAYKAHLAPLGLTYPQYITLTLLWEKDRRNVGDLASCLSMETSTLTPLLKRLATMGLVTRERQKDDERQVIIALSERGKSLQANAAPITACIIEDTGLSLVELEKMVSTLDKLRDGLRRTGSAS